MINKVIFSTVCVTFSVLINSWTSVWLYGEQRQLKLEISLFLEGFRSRAIKLSREYSAVLNVWNATDNKNYEDISLVTQCSVKNLYHLLEMSGRWKGPLSVAVFTPGNDFALAIMGTFWLRKCVPIAFSLATFHFVYPSNIVLGVTSVLDQIENLELPVRNHFTYCEKAMVALRKLRQGSNYQLSGIQYPHNTLRNVAIGEVKTRFTLLLDVDTFPAVNVRKQFLEFISSYETAVNGVKEAFVLPAFEIREGLRIPAVKSQLIKEYRKNNVRSFHGETCINCHKSTRFNDWIAIPEAENLSISYEAAWENSFEPFYISESNAISYDERFKQYGFDRISQVCEMFVAGYQFFVLNNAFVVHYGFKRRNQFHSTKELENRRNYRTYIKEFLPELVHKYPKTNRSCEDGGKRKGRAQVKFLPLSKT